MSDTNALSGEPPLEELTNFSNSYETRASLFASLGASTAPDHELAWTEFRSRYAPIIAAFAAKCGTTRQDVDDIIQDVLTSFRGTHGEFNYDQTKGRFRGCLKTCMVRAAIGRAGKNLRFRGIPLDEIPKRKSPFRRSETMSGNNNSCPTRRAQDRLTTL